MSVSDFLLRIILRGLMTAPSYKDRISLSHFRVLVESTKLVLREHSLSNYDGFCIEGSSEKM